MNNRTCFPRPRGLQMMRSKLSTPSAVPRVAPALRRRHRRQYKGQRGHAASAKSPRRSTLDHCESTSRNISNLPHVMVPSPSVPHSEAEAPGKRKAIGRPSRAVPRSLARGPTPQPSRGLRLRLALHFRHEHHVALRVVVDQPRVSSPSDHGLEGLLRIIVGQRAGDVLLDAVGVDFLGDFQ